MHLYLLKSVPCYVPCLGQHAVPPYGLPNLGALTVRIDDGPERLIYPVSEPREIVLARKLSMGKHIVRIIYRTSDNRGAARIEEFGYNAEPTGELAFSITGNHNAYLVDVRAILTNNNKVVVNRLVRNWLNGQCRMTGLPPYNELRRRFCCSILL